MLFCGAVHAQYDERLPIPVAHALKAAAVPTSAVAVVVQEVDSPRTRVSRSEEHTSELQSQR